MSAATKVKVLSPEIRLIALGQGVPLLETNIGTHAKGECVFGVPGSQTVAGKQIVYTGTWESHGVFVVSFQQAEEARRKYGDVAVGSLHSREIGRAHV